MNSKNLRINSKFSELKMDDFIVHKKYGICLYNGLIQKEINNIIGC